MTQKSNFRTLPANVCQAFQDTCNGRLSANNGNGANTRICADAMEVEITFSRRLWQLLWQLSQPFCHRLWRLA